MDDELTGPFRSNDEERPAHRATPPRETGRGISRPISKTLLKLMLSSASPEEVLLMKLAVQTAIRAKEQFDMRSKDLDLERERIFIEHRKSGGRVIPITPSLCADLAKHRADSPRSGDDDFVFRRCAGKSSYAHLTRTRFGKLYEKAMLAWPQELAPPPKPIWHGLRLFAVESWVRAGLPWNAIEAFAGHTPRTPINKFGRFDPEYYRAQFIAATTSQLDD